TGLGSVSSSTCTSRIRQGSWRTSRFRCLVGLHDLSDLRHRVGGAEGLTLEVVPGRFAGFYLAALFQVEVSGDRLDVGDGVHGGAGEVQDDEAVTRAGVYA